MHLVRHVRHGRDDVHIEFAIQTLLNNLHMQQPQETAAETEPEGQRRFGLVSQRGVVQVQFFERSAQVFVLVGLDRVESRKNHRFHILEPGDGFLARIGNRSDRIADLDVGRGFDPGNNISHVAGTHHVARSHLEFQYAHFVGRIFAAGIEQLDTLALAQRAVENPIIGDDASKRIEHRVENQRLQRSLRIALRSRNTLDNGSEHLFDALSGLARSGQNAVGIAPEQVDDLVLHLVDHRSVHVDLIQHRNNLQIVLQRKIQVRNGLSLNPLRSIDHQQRPLARCDRTRYLVREIDVPRSIDQVQHVLLAPIGILHLDRMALDGDPLLPLQFHIVEHLRLQLARGQRLGHLQQTVRQRAFTVVDMGYDTKIPDILHTFFLKLRKVSYFCES